MRRGPISLTRRAHGPGEALYPNLWAGLVGHWSTSIGYQGQTLYDMSGHNRDAVCQNMGSGWRVNRGRLGINLDGTNDYLITPDSTWGLSIYGTMALWCAVVGTDKTILSLGNNALSNEFLLYIWATGKATIFNHKSGGNYAYRAGSTTINNAQWFHIAGVIDGGGGTANLRIYVNGLNEVGTTGTAGSPTAPVDTTPRHMHIGNRQTNAVDGIAGTFQDVSLYSRVLSAAEIWQLAQGASPLTPKVQHRNVFVQGGAAGRPWSYYAQQRAQAA